MKITKEELLKLHDAMTFLQEAEITMSFEVEEPLPSGTPDFTGYRGARRGTLALSKPLSDFEDYDYENFAASVEKDELEEVVKLIRSILDK